MNREDQIVAEIGNSFATFGGGRTTGADYNPMVTWTKDKPLMFAMGVDVRAVVRFVLKAAKRKPRR